MDGSLEMGYSSNDCHFRGLTIGCSWLFSLVFPWFFMVFPWFSWFFPAFSHGFPIPKRFKPKRGPSWCPGLHGTQRHRQGAIGGQGLEQKACRFSCFSLGKWEKAMGKAMGKAVYHRKS
jgi:hypothetical protein